MHIFIIYHCGFDRKSYISDSRNVTAISSPHILLYIDINAYMYMYVRYTPVRIDCEVYEAKMSLSNCLRKVKKLTEKLICIFVK